MVRIRDRWDPKALAVFVGWHVVLIPGSMIQVLVGTLLPVSVANNWAVVTTVQQIYNLLL